MGPSRGLPLLTHGRGVAPAIARSNCSRKVNLPPTPRVLVATGGVPEHRISRPTEVVPGTIVRDHIGCRSLTDGCIWVNLRLLGDRPARRGLSGRHCDRRSRPTVPYGKRGTCRSWHVWRRRRLIPFLCRRFRTVGTGVRLVSCRTYWL